MIKASLAAGSIASLLVCLVAPFLYLWNMVDMARYKSVLLIASVGWFVLATAWASRAKRRDGPGEPGPQA